MLFIPDPYSAFAYTKTMDLPHKSLLNVEKI